MTFAECTIYVLLPLAGYLLGSIPFAWVIGKAHGVDIRNEGSKNIGATNLGRTLGKRFFWQAFVLDAAKGFFPVLVAAIAVQHLTIPNPQFTEPVRTATTLPDGTIIHNFNWSGRYTHLPSWTPLLTAIACVLGHNFPLYLKFKGGKGVATSFGVVLGFWPLYTLAGILGGLVFVFMLMVYRYISLASMTAACAFAALVGILGNWRNPYVETYLPWNALLPLLAVACLFALMIIIRHRGNIGRLLKGSEPRIGQRTIDRSKM